MLNSKLIFKITGGLGNQMFQYAYAKSLSLRVGADFKLDISEYERYFRPYELERVFRLDVRHAELSEIPFYETLRGSGRYSSIFAHCAKVILKKANPHHYVERTFAFDKYFSTIRSGYVEGYFQTEKYFSDFESDIRRDFAFAPGISKKNSEVLALIKNTNSVSVHVRRGDYVSSKAANVHHGTCGLDYYALALEIVRKKIHSPTLFVFSDDIPWVRQNLRTAPPTHYVDWNAGETSYEDMRLMSHCKHNVIANSSFSWWGAWLGTFPEKIVISPKKWVNNPNMDTTDLIPRNWITV